MILATSCQYARNVTIKYMRSWCRIQRKQFRQTASARQTNSLSVTSMNNFRIYYIYTWHFFVNKKNVAKQSLYPSLSVGGEIGVLINYHVANNIACIRPAHPSRGFVSPFQLMLWCRKSSDCDTLLPLLLSKVYLTKLNTFVRIKAGRVYGFNFQDWRSAV